MPAKKELRNIGQILRVIQKHKGEDWYVTLWDSIALADKEVEPTESIRHSKSFLELICDLEGVKPKFRIGVMYCESLGLALRISPSLTHALLIASAFPIDRIDNLQISNIRKVPGRFSKFKMRKRQLRICKQLRRYLLKILDLKENKKIDLSEFRRQNAKT